MTKRLIAEFIGTAGLVIAIIGSGIMGETLAQGNAAIALLGASVATGAGLFALIRAFGHISGAHFNPVVSLVERMWNRLTTKELLAYSIIQILGAMAGVWLTHFMFGQDVLQLSTQNRSELRFFISEVIATFGLLMVIAFSGKRNPEAVPMVVSLFVTSAFWCTSSTCFVNPAVTIARTFTNTFCGILWTGTAGFIAAQFVGAFLAFRISRFLS